MTAAVTPGRELLELADEIDINFRIGADHRFSNDEARIIQTTLRLAAKDDGVRKAFKPFADWLENCGLDDFPDDHRITRDPGPQLTIGDLRRLTATLNPPTTGEPKR